MLFAWEKRKIKLENDFAITAWALSVSSEVRLDVVARMKGPHHDAIERTITKLYAYDVDANVPALLSKFWEEFKHFKEKTGVVFGNVGRWHTPEAISGRSHVWHFNYSLPHTDVLGMVACRTTSKLLGIGSAERAWGDVKHLKSNKRSHLGSNNTEKQAILYTTARINEARIKREAMEDIHAQGKDAMWGDDDVK